MLSLPNLKHKAIIDQLKHLASINMNKNDTKPELPIHQMLGASGQARINVPQMSRSGSPGEPVAESTRFAWAIMSPGNGFSLKDIMLLRTSIDNYEKLCNCSVQEFRMFLKYKKI